METLTELTSQRLLDDTMTVLKTHIPLSADGYRCQTDDLWRVLLAAMAHQRSIEAACTDLATVPHPNTIRGYLADQWQPKEMPTLEAQVNAALRAALPDWLPQQPRHIAIDTHDMPFYGREDDPEVAAWVCHGQAKASTTAHYRCATAAVLTRDARVTLAMVFVQPGMSMATIVAQLLAGIAAAKVRIACLYADKGFCSVGVIQHLERAEVPAIIAMPARGTVVKGLRRGAASRWAQHTLQSASDGSVTVRVAVVRTYQRSKRKRRRATWCLFVCLRRRIDLLDVRRQYRTRFGIESGYRQLEQVRLRTTSTNPALRLMLAGIAVVLLNVWIWAHWQYLRVPGRGPRRVQRALLRLRRFQSFVLAAVTECYGRLTTLPLAGFRPPSPSDGQANL